MEPGNYLRIFLGRWKVIALAGLIGLAAGFFTAPAKPRPAPAFVPPPTLYTATNILISDSSPALGLTVTPGRVIPDQNLGLTALLATVGEVPKRAAEALGITPPEVIEAAISVVPDTDVGTLRIVATDSDGTRAADIANTVALKLQDYLREQKRERYQAELQDADTLVKDLQRQLDAVQASISRLPVLDVRNPPSDPVLNAQRDAITKRLQAAKDRITAVQAAGDPTSGLLTLQVARPVESVGTPAPVSPNQNAGGGRRTATTVAAPATTVQSAPAAQASGGTAKLARKLRMPIAGGMGLFLGAGLALLRERFDARVRTRRAAERAFGLPVVAEIPKAKPGRRLFGEIAVDAEPLGIQAESYRLLRSRVLQADAGSLWIAAGPPSAAIADTSRNGHSVSADANLLSTSHGHPNEDGPRWANAEPTEREQSPSGQAEPALAPTVHEMT